MGRRGDKAAAKRWDDLEGDYARNLREKLAAATATTS